MFGRKTMSERKIFILIIAFLLGLFIVVEMRSFEDLNEELFRDSRSNVFQEIKILRSKNKDLEKEISELTLNLEQLKDQNSALAAIDQEIGKYRKLSGNYQVFGPGLTIKIPGNITTPWLIDIVNELFNAGAEAVSINGIRITNFASGFDTIPNGQILLNGVVINKPYEISAIGESSDILDILNLPGGIFDRFDASFPDIYLEITEKDIIQMG